MMEAINLVIEGQNERTILEKSKFGYLSKCKVMTGIIKKHPELFQDTLEPSIFVVLTEFYLHWKQAV